MGARRDRASRLKRTRCIRFTVVALIVCSAAAVVPRATAATGTGDCAEAHLERRSAATTPTAVLFVHGVTASAAVWREPLLRSTASMIDYMATVKGVALYTFDYGPHSLDWVADPTIGPHLANAIDCLARSTGKKVVVVAHSMGGLATLWASHQRVGGRSVGDELAEVITIGTPTLGSQAAQSGDEIEHDYPALWAIFKLCGINGEHHPTDSKCAVLSSVDTRAGRAMRPGSSELAQLGQFPASVPVHRIAGDETVEWNVFWSTRSVAVGDVMVARSSATAAGTDAPFADPCTDAIVLFWQSSCYHGNLTQNPAIAADVLVHVQRATTRAAVEAAFPSLGCLPGCRITGQISFKHPTWGSSTLVTIDSNRECGSVALVALDHDSTIRWKHTLSCYEQLSPATPSKDTTGHLFVDFNPGRYNGVIVLEPVAGGFRDFATLPTADLGGYDTRFYDAFTRDLDHDGKIEIVAESNNCDPDCAGGTVTTRAYWWSGSDYVPRPWPTCARALSLIASMTSRDRDLVGRLYAASIGMDPYESDGLRILGVPKDTQTGDEYDYLWSPQKGLRDGVGTDQVPTRADFPVVVHRNADGTFACD